MSHPIILAGRLEDCHVNSDSILMFVSLTLVHISARAAELPSNSCPSVSPVCAIAIVIFCLDSEDVFVFMPLDTVQWFCDCNLVLHMRKDSISAEIMALRIVRWPCGSAGTGSIRCRPISLQLTLTVPANIR